MSDLPNPETLTRQPGQPSAGGEPETQVTPEQALEEQKQRLEQAERDRERDAARVQTLEREKDAALRQAQEAGSRVLSAQEQAIETSIQAHNAAAEQAKAAIANAQAAGDSMAVADAFDKLAEARANLRSLNDRKTWLATERERQQQRAETQVPSGTRVRTPGGEIEVSGGAKQWMDAHPRFYSDGAYYNHAVAAHATITADGIGEGTPAYFRALDEAMTRFERFEAFERGDHTEKPQMNNGQQRQRPASSMGAPVSRTTTQPRNDGAPDPIAIARSLGPGITVDDLREFARVNGYRGDAGFAQYLKDQQEIADIQRMGGDTGLRVDGVYR